MKWQSHSFNSLSTHLLFTILKARVDVFVVEQECAYPELDDKDTHEDTLHLTACDGGELKAYARLLPPGLSYPSVSIGRVLTTASARGAGLGHKLVHTALETCEERWPGADIEIGAQEHLRVFYEKFGFVATSTMYLEDGIPHIDMKLSKAVS